ncbi:protein-tyrosine-phosphatase [Frankia sp. CcI49]|uniref:tyrosine-protein phosphatase n=1 Tax=Frankia sp. CcI49 TaxID=1745382 RepID=UPI000975E311|nr:tyrosine-protein phosphatase [Frankia sp. CcI49]ONH60631.1 protein-tyrosine-phosphatase [Frankia sp. CcI49]
MTVDTVENTEVTESAESAESDRRGLELPGAVNLRDVGGYRTTDGRRVRWRTLLRCGAMHALTDTARARFAQFGLRSVVDLREAGERAQEPDALGQLPARSVWVPIYTVPPADAAPTDATPATAQANTAQAAAAAPGAAAAAGANAAMDVLRGAGAAVSLQAIYDFAVDNRGDRLTAAVLALAEPGALPGIVHCSAGKDRTGMVVAMVLDLCGVPDETIAADFALTARYLREEAIAAVRQLAGAGDGAGGLPTNVMACPPQLILDTLERIRARHGDVRGYLLAHGATPQALDRLVEALLTDDNQ